MNVNIFRLLIIPWIRSGYIGYTFGYFEIMKSVWFGSITFSV